MQVLENSVKRQENGQNIGLMGIQKVSWEEGGREPADDYAHLYGKGNTNHHLVTGSLVHKLRK
jgi:hypothetical protein